ncbi:sulfite oxidase heme-binding subunit YedZ [Marinibaculum pumilum]|uniref:Protein-methionine-sulfoxide reductase heme-binding subunit MsrQ n=1 Tax=Marinibaculum pumilum TaxID=1766165 RepID=A0ABV7L5H4_9PROT
MSKSVQTPPLPFRLMPAAADLPWNDRAGRFAALRAIAFAAAVLPAAWFAAAALSGAYDPEPTKAVLHLTGLWTLYFLLATLAITPMRRLLSWPRLAGLRRMLGLTAFAYVAGHLVLYAFNENLDLAMVASEIASRIYLTIGFVALAGLAVLAATSCDAAIRRLGQRWRHLHRAVYPLAALGLLHFFMQSKLDISEAAVLSGLFVALMLYRLHDRWRLGLPLLPRILAVAGLAGIAAAGLEYAWYAIATGVPAGQVLLANLDPDRARPIWAVMAICALPLPVLWVRQWLALPAGQGARPTAA